MKTIILTAVSCLACSLSCGAGAELPPLYFDRAVLERDPPIVFDAALGYGYEPVFLPAPGKPALFSVALPEGVWRVKVTLGGAAASNTTLKAEARQLVLHDLSLGAGETTTRSFLVSVRTPRIDEKTNVKIKDREVGHLRWDEKLTLEINGSAPALTLLSFSPAHDAPVVYLVGDSTVADQGSEPWNSWGQMLPAMLDLNQVAVSNHAESGESYSSFLAERRWDKILATLRKGDVVIMQMGHNDMKQKGDGAGPFLNYKTAMEKLVRETKQHGATPVLVTPVHRRAFNDDGTVKQTLGDYPEAVRAVAKEQGVLLVDLNALSKPLYESFGKDGSAALFVDGTHHNNYGSYLLARCVAEGLRQSPDLAPLLKADLEPFDPAHPPSVADLHLPASPQRDPARPEGN